MIIVTSFRGEVTIERNKSFDMEIDSLFQNYLETIDSKN